MTSPRPAGRYAPSPSGPLHIGNLRTALIAWAWARSTDRRFLLRIDDIDPGRYNAADQQIAELESLGIDWDGSPIYQSSRLHLYEAALDSLAQDGRVFECYCSRKDIREAASAPHGVPGLYPGTCRSLPDATREARRAELAAQGRLPALRLAALADTWTVTDEIHGTFTGAVDAFVLRRGDGGPAYNVATVVDDSLTGVDQVVRGDDLLPSSPAQGYLASLLGFASPTYGHVPLVLNQGGQRLAKRDGAVTLEDLRAIGWETGDVLHVIGASLGVPEARTAAEFLAGFDAALIPRGPDTFSVEAGLRPYLPA